MSDALAYQKLDDVYHSETPEEMCLKIALHGVPSGIDHFFWLCETFCYHYGFWPHTRPRFQAFKKVLSRKSKKHNPFFDFFKERSTDIICFVATSLEHAEKEFGTNLRHLPGQRNEIRAWKQLLRIVER